MNVDKIARLFSAQSEPALQTTQQQQQSASQGTAAKSAPNSEAVTIAQSLKSGSAQNDDSSARADKVARLKAAVDAGSYNPNSREVGAAVYKELLL